MSLCALCGQARELRRSHVIPNFVVRDVLDASPSGELRWSGSMNIPRTQIETYPLLCEKCEQQPGRVEREFKHGIFDPLYSRPIEAGMSFEYGEWLLRFQVSIAWRIVVRDVETMYRRNVPVSPCIEEAAAVWREYLLGHRKDPGRFDHHALFALPLIQHGTIDMRGVLDLPPAITRELNGGHLTAQLITRQDEIFTCSNIGSLLLVTCIQPRQPHPRWSSPPSVRPAGRSRSPRRWSSSWCRRAGERRMNRRR